jgi:hypothetical protein
VDHRNERQARNEALVRHVNEEIERLDQAAAASGLADVELTFEFHCECGRADGDEVTCHERVEMTLREYEEVRSQDDRFAVAAGHENPEIEDVVRRTDRFVIVDKNPDAEPLVEDDPRGAPSG